MSTSAYAPRQSSGAAAQNASKANRNAAASGMSSSQTAGSSARSCPLQRKPIKPCDLKSVTLTDQGSKLPRSVSAKAGVKSKAAANIPPAKKKLTTDYDLVLETLSDIIIEGKSATGAKYTKIVPAAEYNGGCEDHASLTFVYRPLNPDANDPILDEKKFHNLTLYAPLPAKTWVTDKRNLGAQDIGAFFTRNEDQVKEVEIVFESCGVPRPPEVAKAKTMRGLVRVYRNETIDFALSFPPIRERTYSKKKEADEGGPATSVTRTNAKTPQYTDTVKKDAQGNLQYSSERKTGWVSQTTTSYEYDPATRAVTEKKPEKKLKLKLTISRNGEELNGLAAVNQWIENYFSMTEMLVSTLTSVQKMIPKVGYSLSCDISLVEGEINAGLGYRPATALDTEAYKWIESYGKIGFDLKLFNIAFKFGFGVEASSPALIDWLLSNGEKAFELILMIRAELSAELHLKGEKKLFEAKTEAPKDVEIASAPGSAKLDVNAQGKVTIDGLTWDAKCGVEAGIDFGGTLLMAPLDVEFLFQLRPGVIYAYFNYPGKGQPSPRWEYQIWAEGEKHTRRMLHP